MDFRAIRPISGSMRQDALDQMTAFAPGMGRRYSAGRNTDRGPGQYKAVSTLSPYIRRRLITEAELVQTAIAHHGLDGAEKFVQEVFWRGYFKGWLERRPDIWTSYTQGLIADCDALELDRRLRFSVEDVLKLLREI